MKFDEIFAYQLTKYPEMRSEDAVKLAFQSTYGGGHMIASPELAMKRLESEYAQLPHSGEPKIEVLGEYSRVYLDCRLSELELRLIGRIFVESANYPLESEPIESKLGVIRAAAESGKCVFSSDELERYLKLWRESGCPAVSHSAGYRELYRPSYRVIDSRYARLLPLIFELGRRLESKPRVILAIDGRAASGKSTAAELIGRIFGGNVIHTDDFFLPYEMRTPERLSEPGGNLDRERFIAEVIASLPGGGEYRCFDCSVGGFKPEPHCFGSDGLLTVEGCYSLHPDFGSYFDLAAFLTLEPEEQCSRILARNGEALLARFVDDWIPMEERYFEHFEIAKKCDLIL